MIRRRTFLLYGFQVLNSIAQNCYIIYFEFLYWLSKTGEVTNSLEYTENRACAAANNNLEETVKATVLVTKVISHIL